MGIQSGRRRMRRFWQNATPHCVSLWVQFLMLELTYHQWKNAAFLNKKKFMLTEWLPLPPHVALLLSLSIFLYKFLNIYLFFYVIFFVWEKKNEYWSCKSSLLYILPHFQCILWWMLLGIPSFVVYTEPLYFKLKFLLLGGKKG